jgi:hypothetical protein
MLFDLETMRAVRDIATRLDLDASGDASPLDVVQELLRAKFVYGSELEDAGITRAEARESGLFKESGDDWYMKGLWDNEPL